MGADAIFQFLCGKGIQLSVRGEKLVVRGWLTTEERALIRANKLPLLAMLSVHSEIPSMDQSLLWWRVAAVSSSGRRTEIDWPSGITLEEANSLVKKQFGENFTVAPLVLLTSGPYEITHADGWHWTFYPPTGVHLGKNEIRRIALERIGGVHGDVANIEVIEQ